MTATATRTVVCGYCHKPETIAQVRDCARAYYAGRRQPTAPAPRAEVKAGRYALDRDGTIKFYVVDRPIEGRWAGRTFVSVMASDEKHAIRNPREREAILDLIAADAREAMARYGQLIGKCGVCGRTLTDAESRAIGIGPICAERF